MAQYTNKKSNENRICYVDPNDVRGGIKNYETGKEQLVPVMPDYTEFSIWCNLTVEHTSRLKNQGNGTNGDITSISWDMTNADLRANNVSFLQGKDAIKYNFLTTDYTNIDFDEIRQRNIVEGLQVQQVNISFTNYQTPQITIKFVDIRGGGFFGREEATHNEFGELTNLQKNESNELMDNVFSCFVSFPYPRFRLQVKGFYGKAVTYQLSCTSFSGSFNSQTGNFEITVQFIGYEYGILGDIPFDLLVAAPLTPFGEKYWADHVNSEAWALDSEKREVPEKLNDIYGKISSCLNGTNQEEVDDEVDETIEEMFLATAQKLEKLNEINSKINEFKKCVVEVFGRAYVTECYNNNEDVIIIYNNTQVYENTNKLHELCEIRNKIKDLVEKYNRDFNYDSLSFDIVPNNDNQGTTWSISYPLVCTDFMQHCESNGHYNVLENGKIIDNEGSCTDFTLQKMYTGGKYNISEGVSKQIYNDLKIRSWSLYGRSNQGMPFARFATVITLGNTNKEINERITKINEDYTNYVYNIKTKNDQGILDLVKFTPYIGRFFKIVMCHLETFVALINHYADSIYELLDNKKRYPSDLGIKTLPAETDVPDTYKQVPPFPAVYKKYMTDEELSQILNNGNNVKETAWIGDFGDHESWLERALVDELYIAAQRIANTRTNEITTTASTSRDIYNYNSFMPVDYYIKAPDYAYATDDGAMFYAALRAEIMLDLMQRGENIDTSYANTLGMYDAYVYAKQCKESVFLKRFVANNNLANDLYNSTVYGNVFKSHDPFEYEMGNVYNNRHPVFIENGDNVKYSFMTNEVDGTGFIPLENKSTLRNSNGFANNYNYGTGKDFLPKDKNSNTFLIPSSKAVSGDTYPNTYHFDIITDDAAVEQITSSYFEFKQGNEKMGNKESKDFVKTLDKHMLVSNERFESFYYSDMKNQMKSFDFSNMDNINITNLENLI